MINHDARSHAICGASNASRWLKCPGSVSLCLKCDELPATPWAIEGTKAHEMADEMLHAWQAGTLPPRDADDDFQTDPGSMREHIMRYVRLCQDEVAKLTDAVVRVETRLELDEPLGMFGTVDLLATGKLDGVWTGLIVDLKYGTGIPMKAAKNPQVAYYAVALWLRSSRPLKQVKSVICQVRLANGTSSWMLDEETLRECHKMLIDGAKRATYQAAVGQPTFQICDGCRWCAAQSICPAQEEAYGRKA